MTNRPVRDRVAEDPPARSTIDRVTESIPDGPLGFLGDGDVLGFAGFLAVESGELITSPIPGMTRPGFRKMSHSVEVIEEGLQRHTVVVHAFSKDVAEFMVQYTGAPSNFDYIKGDTEIVNIEEMDKGAVYDTYKIVAEIDRRPIG